MYDIDPTDLRLVREFKASPLGRHSPDLQRLVRVLRTEPPAGKYAVLCTRPNREWVLVQLSGERGRPPIIHEDQVFTDLRAAEWEIFKRRWEKRTGRKLDLD